MRKITAVWIISLVILSNLLIINTPKASSSAQGEGTWVEGDIYEDTTWTPADSPYKISKDVRVHDNATLTIEPDVKVRFGGDFSITIHGNLSAVGTEVNNIVFTSNKESPGKGDWDTIKFVGGENHSFAMEHCVIEYAKKGITCESSNPGSKLGEKSSTLSEKGFDNKINNKYKSHIATSEDIETMKASIGVRDPNKNYNIIIDGHGTGLAPPTEEEWDEMIGKVRIADSVSAPRSPGSVDHSQEPYFPTVGDQGSQGSCAAWATTYYTNGYQQALDNNWTDASTGNTSHLMSPAWTFNKCNYGIEGSGSHTWTNAEVIQSVGSAPWSTMPYSASDHVSWGSEDAWRNAPEYRGGNIYTTSAPFSATTINIIKNALDSNHVVTFALNHESYSGLGSGDDTITSAEIVSGYDHANTIVGYNDSKTADGEIGAFKIVNSWGANWGASWGGNGYYWMTYKAFLPGEYAIVWFDDLPNYQPSLLGVWNLSPQGARNASVILGVGDHGSPKETRSPEWDGGSHNFPSFMCLDITEFEDNCESGTNNFYLEIGSGSSPSTITSFKVEHYIDGYIPGSPSQVSDESPDTPKDTPCNVTASLDLLKQTVDYITITDSANGSELITVILPFGGSITAYASGYNSTSGYVGLVECNWSGSGGSWSPTASTTSTFTAGLIAGTYTQTAQNTALGVSDTFDVEILAPPSKGKVSITNCEIRKNNGEGVRVTGNYNFTIKNTTVSDNNGQGIHLDSDNEGFICNSTVRRNGINGIYLSNSKHIDISCNSISQNGENGVYVCGSGSSNITIENNMIEENGNEGIYVYSHGGYDVYYKNGMFVYTPLWWGSCYIQNIVISDNTISYNENGIHVYSYTYEFVKVENTNNYISTSVYSSDSSFISNTKISNNNTISYNAKHGIFINSYSYAYADSSASGTFVSASATSTGYSQISNTTILNNNIFSNGEEGIYVYSDSFSCSYGNASNDWSDSSASAESYSAISNSVISGNTIDGVYFYSNSYSNGSSNAYGFRCYSNTDTDSLSSISDSVISNNTISSNMGNGIYIQGNGFSSGYAYGDGTYAYYDENGILHTEDVSRGYTTSHATGDISTPTIFNNTVGDNEGNGIYVHGYGSKTEEKKSYGSVSTTGYAQFYYIKIRNSTISGNGDSGIKIEMSGNFIADYSELTNNTISYHDNYGIYYSGIKNNKAHFNNIIENGFSIDPEYGKGMWIEGGSDVNAEQNFWGGYEGDYHSTPVGPYHVSLNPNATGNAVNGDGVNLDFVLPLTGPVIWLYIRPTSSISIDKIVIEDETTEIVGVNETTVGLNESVVFDASNSTAAFDSINNRNLSVAYYRFDYGDGTVTEWVTTWVVVHKYSSPGTYTVNLTVKDEYGLESNNASASVIVEDNETAVLLNGSLSSSNGNGTTIFYYNVTYMDKEGDTPNIRRVYIEGNRIYDNGSADKYYKMGNMTWVQGENNPGALYSYNTTLPRGEYKYYFVFTTNFDDWNSTIRLPVSSYSSYYKGPAVSVNYPPVAYFSYWPAQPTSADKIRFRIPENQCYDPDGDIILWELDFGDDSPPETYDTTPPRFIYHQYSHYSEYTVTLTVTDNNNATDTYKKNITVENEPPTATNLFISPALPNTTNNLTANYDYYDIDENDEKGTEIRWYKNGEHLPEFDNENTVPSSATSKGEIWYFTVKPKDGMDFGVSHTSPSVTIQNSAPTVTNLTISPPFPLTTNDLTANYDYYDIDGDEENGTEIRWYKNDKLQSGFNNIIIIPSSATNKRDVWYFTVKPKDETDFGNLMKSSNVTLSNIPPVANFTYSPENPTNMDIVEFTDNSSDVDGYIVSWHWDFDGDGVYDWNSITTGNTTHQYPPGIYNTVTLTVTDDNNASNNFTQKIIVSKKIIPSPPKKEIDWLPYIIGVIIIVIVVVGIVLFLVWKAKKKKPEKAISEKTAMKLKCKKCGEIFPVEINEKPFTFKCPKCGTEGTIK